MVRGTFLSYFLNLQWKRSIRVDVWLMFPMNGIHMGCDARIILTLSKFTLSQVNVSVVIELIVNMVSPSP